MSATPIADKIQRIIQENFSPSHIELVDDSHQHAGHAGSRDSGETHFRLLMVSDKFDGKSKVARQKAVYKALQTMIDDKEIHALQLFTYASDEF